MYVFGIDLPVAEILFFVLVLFVLGLAIIIYLLVRLNSHINALDEMSHRFRKGAGGAPRREDEE